jgi:hypothetical protein
VSGWFSSQGGIRLAIYDKMEDRKKAIYFMEQRLIEAMHDNW